MPHCPIPRRNLNSVLGTKYITFQRKKERTAMEAYGIIASFIDRPKNGSETLNPMEYLQLQVRCVSSEARKLYV